MRGWLGAFQRVAPWLNGAAFGLFIAHIFFGASDAARDGAMFLVMLGLIPAMASLPRFNKFVVENKND